MNSPTLYQSPRTGALYRFVPHTNTERAMETFNHAN